MNWQKIGLTDISSVIDTHSRLLQQQKDRHRSRGELSLYDERLTASRKPLFEVLNKAPSGLGIATDYSNILRKYKEWNEKNPETLPLAQTDLLKAMNNMDLPKISRGEEPSLINYGPGFPYGDEHRQKLIRKRAADTMDYLKKNFLKSEDALLIQNEKDLLKRYLNRQIRAPRIPRENMHETDSDTRKINIQDT